ncbi:hypothetical protein AB1Y20_017571 [Prymnesium parvum]|uniref:PDZ domain-containing protein n=1 Tax=Prymnesium parvum TaxID=97485 RepID=A0AB34JPU4_PRYPA
MRAELRALIDQKDALERQIMEISDALTAQNMGGVSGPLVDPQGFPRADIDVHLTRTLRHQLACLNTDHQRLMAQIEQGMQAHFASLAPARAAEGGAVGTATAARATAPDVLNLAPTTAPMPPIAVAPRQASSALPSFLANGHDALVPFAEIDEVAEGGPAAEAGIRRGDKLLSFGGLTAANHDQLRALARLTQRSEGDTVSLLVLRTEASQEQRVSLVLHPHRWQGQGLLGCHLRPL